jgi:hypothetical protein
MPPPKSAPSVTDLNDAFRRSFAGGRVLLTATIAQMPPAEVESLLSQVRAFDAFDKENDPYGEHDFGAVEQNGEQFFWKIDYYIPELTGGSEHPADPVQTTRVLTIMRADEY